jgi:hypothetical protein
MRSKALWTGLALVAVLGITTAASPATRSLITGNMIKLHQITSKHLVDHTIQAHDLSATLVTSLTGIAGHQVVSHTFSISPGHTVTGNVTVPDGKVVLGGGIKPGNPTALSILGSYPSMDGKTWTVIVSERSDSHSATTFTVYAVAGREAAAAVSSGRSGYAPPSHRPGPQP